MKRLVISLILLAACTGQALATNTPTSWGGRRDGFQFYKDPAQQPAQEKVPYSRGDFNGTIDWKAVRDMHPGELRVLIEDVKDYAIQTPSEDRVLAYLTLQAIVMQKAKRFQEMASDVVFNNPVLDASARRPPSSYVSGLLASLKRRDRDDVLEKMKEDMGLVFFYTENCGQACKEAGGLLQEFVNHVGWANFLTVDVSNNPQVIEEFKIQMVPDIWVVGNVDGKVQKRRVKAGVATWSHVEDGLLKAYTSWFKGTKYELLPYDPVLEFDDFVDQMPLSIDGNGTETTPKR